MKKQTLKLGLITLALIFMGADIDSVISINEKEDGGKKYKKEFTVEPNGKLNIDLQSGGSIEIKGWSKNVVDAEVHVDGKNAEDVVVEITKEGNEILINSFYEQNGRNKNSREKVFVKIPNKFNVNFETMGGGVKIQNADGTFEGKTMGGSIDLAELKGEISITTMGGAIKVVNSAVDGKVKTMGGQVYVENVTGDLDASSMGGNVIQKSVKGKNKNIGKEVNISTMGGEINVDNAPNGAKVKTMGGDIVVNSASVFVDATTFGGDIEIKEVDGKVKAKTYGGDISVNQIQNGNQHGIELVSLSGDIVLSVPADFSMDVFIEIAYTKDRDAKYDRFEDVKVVSDFKLTEERSGEWDYSHGSPRKYLYGKGNLNGGKNKVIIKTINGDVELKKI